MQNPITLIPIPLPPPEQQVNRNATFAAAGEKRNRYHLPEHLDSPSPVGYRKRLPLTETQAAEAATLLSLEPPSAFVTPDPVSEQALFEESALSILSSRQSTNFKGHRQYTFGPQDSQEIATLLTKLKGIERPISGSAAYTHIVISRPYRTPFTMLLTFVGHAPLQSLWTVPQRALRKKYEHIDDIPTIGYLPMLHIGILADAMERAVVLASEGKRQAQIFLAPFCSAERQRENAEILNALEKRIGLSPADRALGWRIRLIAQVGQIPTPLPLSPQTCRTLAANILAFRSERIQPGVNQEEKAPPAYQKRQDMDIPEALAFQAGRAAYNAFCHWSGSNRDQAKKLLLMERVDVLTPNGKDRLREIREQLTTITDKVVENIPLWADLPLGRALSRNAARGRKAFALAGQRIYIGGLDRNEIAKAGIPWERAVQALGAAAARSALTCELSGCINLPPHCDLLSGICLMAGPVNQNDIGKQFFGYKDLLSAAHPHLDPTSLLVWTLKAKTVADPIGNEEQLLNAEQKGALVDLRQAPADVVKIYQNGQWSPMRAEGNTERAYSDMGNFITDPNGKTITNNAGRPHPQSNAALW